MKKQNMQGHNATKYKSYIHGGKKAYYFIQGDEEKHRQE